MSNKTLKITGIISIALFLIWLLALLVYAFTNPQHPRDKDLPDGFYYPLLILFTIWILIGLYLLIKNFKTIWGEVGKFINE